MSENNIPHIVDQGASFVPHEGIKRKPLTDEEIENLAYEYNLLDDHPHEFVRAIEKAHGIE